MSLFSCKSRLLYQHTSLKTSSMLTLTSLQYRFKGGFTPADMPIIKRKWNAATKVGKICESMKNIAAAALPMAERHLSNARPFGSVTLPIFELENESKTASSSLIKNVLHVPIGTERGMCGALSSNTVREANASYMKTKPDRLGNPATSTEIHRVVTIGKRSAAVSNTFFGQDMIRCAGEVKTRVPTFEFCSHVAEYLLYDTNFEWDKLVVYYNEYVNAVRSNLKRLTLYKNDISVIIGELQFPAYEIEADDNMIVANLIEFKLASVLYMAMAENSASEQASRLRSMDSAYKNCLEKEDEYEKIYQGLRKTKITNELIILASCAKIAMSKNLKT